MNPDGTDLQALTQPPGVDEAPAWSWYSTLLAFQRSDGTDTHLFVLDGTGTLLQQVTTTPGFQGEPSWAPDGKRLAFEALVDGAMHVFTVNLDGTGDLDLGLGEAPAWSPLGDALAYHAADGRLWVASPDGYTSRPITVGPQDSAPSWAPDGHAIAFEGRRNGNSDVYTQDLTTGTETRLTTGAAFDGDPSWAPDGHAIAFDSERNGVSQVFVMATDGTSQAPITPGPFDGHPDWGQLCELKDRINEPPGTPHLLANANGLDPKLVKELVDATTTATTCPPPPKTQLAPRLPRNTPPIAEPVLYVHGIAGPTVEGLLGGGTLGNPAGNDCADTWNVLRGFLAARGWVGPHKYIGYYALDTNCNTMLKDSFGVPINGDRDTDIYTLAEGLAWEIYNSWTQHGVNVRIVAHSMGGLIVRTALAKAGSGDPDYPPVPLKVSQVVTLGTPHGGADAFAVWGCSWSNLGVPYECQEMAPGSDFMNWLAASAKNPQGAEGTDWSAVGSQHDFYVDDGSATKMQAHHTYVYRGANCDGTSTVVLLSTPAVVVFGITIWPATYITATFPQVSCEFKPWTWITHTEPTLGHVYYKDTDTAMDSTIDVARHTTGWTYWAEFDGPHVDALVDMALGSDQY